MKPYLLIAGYQHYPARADGDWIGCYETREEAKKMMTHTPGLIHEWKVVKHPVYGKDHCVDWYEIVDLRDWM